MNKIINRQNGIEFSVLVFACVVYAISTVEISPIPLIPGSFLGIAVTMNKALGTSVGVVNFILNVPVVILCLKMFKPKLTIYTGVVIALTSFLIDVWTPYLPECVHHWHPFLVAFIGGVLMGIGAGLILEAGGTMAGTTALLKLIQRKFPKLPFGTTLMIMDVTIILCGAITIREWSALPNALIYVVCYSKIIDWIAWGHEKLRVYLRNREKKMKEKKVMKSNGYAAS